MFLFAEACRHNLQVILHKINAIGMHFIDLNSNEPQQNDGNILLKFPIVTIEELKNFNKLLKEDASVCAKYVNILCILLFKSLNSLILTLQYSKNAHNYT